MSGLLPRSSDLIIICFSVFCFGAVLDVGRELNLGFSPDVVANQLDHANAAMVLNIYDHMYPQKTHRSHNRIKQMYQGQKKRLAYVGLRRGDRIVTLW